MENQKQVEIHTIMTHPRPHLDEIVAIAILQQCGKDRYPGVENAKIAFCDASGTTPDGRSWKKWHAEGTLLVGVGGSCFDEHPTPNKERKAEDCAASLVAKHLGIEDEPWLAKLLKFTTTNDLTGGKNPFDLAAIVSRLNKSFFDRDNAGTIECAVHMMVLPYLQEQMAFFLDAKPDFDQHAEIIKGIHMGKNITIVAIESDNDKIGAYARSAYGAKADVVIQKNSKGNVIITTNKPSQINLTGVIVGLRNAELKLRNIPWDKDRDLTVEGTVYGAEEWYYHLGARQILNGSASTPNVPPTKVRFDKIKQIVVDKLAASFAPRGNTVIKKAFHHQTQR